MAYFKDLNALARHMQNKVIPDVLGNEVYSVAVNTQSRMVQKEVYSKYNPYIYQRRGWSGGLADPSNNRGTFSYQGLGEVQLFIQNVTEGSDQNFYIAPLIEYGDGYHGLEYQYKRNRDNTQYKYLNPRPFISETIKYLEANLAHVDAMKRGLSRWGIRTF